MRGVYLSVLLIGLTVMYRSTDNVVKPEHFANRAQTYATILVVLQNLLVLLFLPVYVASAIVEEKENRTLEILCLSFLTDREMVLGKLGARLMHLGSIVLGGFPLLVFMHLWGNVDIAFLVYHEANTFLLLLTGGGICILISAQSEGVFQAITRSYSWLALLGFVGILVGFLLPWVIGELAASLRFGGHGIPWYLASLVPLAPIYLLLTGGLVRQTIKAMNRVRREERRRLRKVTGAFSLTDNPTTDPSPRPRRAPVSSIHPLALPIRGSALFWKECLKDGTGWSLRAVGCGKRFWRFWGQSSCIISILARQPWRPLSRPLLTRPTLCACLPMAWWSYFKQAQAWPASASRTR